jgi:hypothetical protein
MKIPLHWARGSVEVTDPKGKAHTFTCWGWSDTSPADAEEMGRRKAERTAQRVLRGETPDRYLYGDRPLREEILEELCAADGTRYAAITRNAYGCHVLNTADIMFVDVDLPAPSASDRLRHWLSTWFRKGVPSPAARREAEALAKADAMAGRDAQYGMRAYRTGGGLRYLMTARRADPTSAAARREMQELGADPMYQRLCGAQESFRARLTPKPWRCGMAAPGVRFPWPDDKATQRFGKWETAYRKAADRYAACRFIRQIGAEPVDADIRAVVELHDRLTRASSGLPLA